MPTFQPPNTHSLIDLPLLQTSAAVLCIIVFLYVVYQRTFHPLAKVPGPPIAGLSRFWIAYQSSLGSSHELYLNLHAQYGPVVRVGPNEVSVADVPAFRRIYAAGSGFRKSDWYGAFQGLRKFDLFGERSEKLHGTQRRIVAPIYAMSSVKDLEQYVGKAIKDLFSSLDQVKADAIDLRRWIHLFAFDVIGEVTFSRPFGYMEMGTDDGSLDQIGRVIRNASWIGQLPWLFKINDTLTPYIGNWLPTGARHGSIRNFAVQEINGRKDRGSDRPDLLGKLLTTHQQKPNEFDMMAVTSMATTNIFAGSDTTSNTISAVFYFVMKNPDVKTRLIDEIRLARSEDRISDPVMFEESEKLPYFQACVQESLRLFPATAMLLPRVVPPGGLHVGNHVIPAGATVGASAWVVNRDREVFGPDAYEFNPERWLKGNTADMNRTLFSFGAGSRGCIGKNIAWMEISKLIPTLLLHYDIDLEEPTAQWTIHSYWFLFPEALKVRIRARKTQ